MRKNIKLKLKKCGKNISERCISLVLHMVEYAKYKNPRRVAIYEQIHLTKEQKNEIDTLYLENYGKKIPYVWHRHFTAYTGKFDKNYIPELLYIPEFEAFMNLNKAYNVVFRDKNVTPYLAQIAGIRMPKTIISCVKGIYRDDKNNVISAKAAIDLTTNIGEAFIKPSVDSSSGKNCAFLDVSNGIDSVSGKTIEQIIQGMGTDFVIQEKITCHKSIADIYPHSVNTFRVITYIWKGEIKTLPAILRIGSGGNYVDNAHAGGMFVAVENDGTLHKTAFTEFKKEFTRHPDTKFRFEGYKIEPFPKVLSASKRMHAMFPQIGVANWDFTIDREGEPVLVEVNLKAGAIWVGQMAHGKGAFGEDTAEVLRWMALMKKTKPSDRYKYAYGKCE